MKTALVALVCALLSFAGVPVQQPPDATRAIVDSYLEVHAALASDRFDQVAAPAKTMAKHAATLGQDGEAMVQAANVVASASTIAAARDAFGPLTDAVVARVKADAANAGSSDLRLGYCPMVKKTWVQRGEQVKNPYYGPAMLTCGEMKPLK